MIKHTQEYIKNQIEKHGYKLLSKYISYADKIEIQCPEGHIYKTCWGNFKQGKRCYRCYMDKQKYSHNFIKKEFAKRGYELLSEYNGSQQPLNVKCPEGHITKTITWNRFNNGRGCKICGVKKCSDKLRHTHEFVYKEFKKEGYELISDYNKCNKSLKIKCPNGHITDTMTYSNFKKGQRCKFCSRESKAKKQRHSQKFIENEFAKNGYGLLSKYQHANESLKIKCPNGHITDTMTYSNFKKGQRCNVCATIQKAEKQKLSQKEVEKIISKEGYGLLSKYNGFHEKIKIKCCEGHEYFATLSHFQRGQRCPKCINKSEQKFREVMKEYFGAEFPIKKPKWLVNEAGNRLFLDGYNEELKIAFEYQGRQHFEKVSFFKDTEEKFKKRQKHDKIKKEKCKEMGIILLCPTYKLDESEYREFIKKEMDKNT